MLMLQVSSSGVVGLRSATRPERFDQPSDRRGSRRTVRGKLAGQRAHLCGIDCGPTCNSRSCNPRRTPSVGIALVPPPASPTAFPESHVSLLPASCFSRQDSQERVRSVDVLAFVCAHAMIARRCRVASERRADASARRSGGNTTRRSASARSHIALSRCAPTLALAIAVGAS